MAAPYHAQREALYYRYTTTVDTNLINTILALLDEDQAVRNESVLLEEMAAMDSVHFDQMIAICKNHGYPDRWKSGAKTGYWNLLLWHHRGASEYPGSRQWQAILPIIHAAIQAGRIEHRTCAASTTLLIRIEDRLCVGVVCFATCSTGKAHTD